VRAIRALRPPKGYFVKFNMIVGVGLALAAVMSAAPASALSARTFVSGHCNDANICNFAAPCRTFAGAYVKTAPSGEITVLDPAGYGPLTITTALSIVNDGVGEAGVILIAAGNAITVTAGPSDAISLRGLTLDGGGTASTNGIVFNSGGALTIQNCVIRHFANIGIDFVPNVAGGPLASSNLFVSNTLVAENVNTGILVLPTGSGAVTAVFNRVEVNNNANGGIVVSGETSTGTINATVSGSVAARNSYAGFVAGTATGQAPTTLTLFQSVATSNGNGIRAEGVGATLRAAQSMVTGNTSGWVVSQSGVVQSYGDNYIDGNGSNTGSLTSIVKQ
jgi:hypothetical protein